MIPIRPDSFGPPTARQRIAQKDLDDDLARGPTLADEAAYRHANPKILARITGGQPGGSATPLYSWEFATAVADGNATRDAAGFKSDFSDLPAWENSGNVRVPIDGTAVVELTPSPGGLYYSFDWPERYTPARITAAAGLPHAWVELSPIDGGLWSNLPGGRSGTTTVNPAYERNGATNIPPGTVTWIERGAAATPDVVTAIITHGDGAAVHQVQHVYLSNAVGGEWTLTTVNAVGTYQTTAPLAFDISAAALQVAIRLLAGFGAATVTGAGTSGSPFVVTMLDTFADLLVFVGDPFQLVGVQEWWFDAALSPNTILYRSECVAGVWVTLASYDGGETYTDVVASGPPCGDGIPCRTEFEPWEVYTPGPCIPYGAGTYGIQYQYKSIHQFTYDARGCLRLNRTPPQLVVTGCCVVCTTSHDTVQPGTDCAGVPCGYCAGVTPCQWTFTLDCPDFGGGDVGECPYCSGPTPTSWHAPMAGFINDFAVFNLDVTLVKGGSVGECGWEYLIGDNRYLLFIRHPSAGHTQLEVHMSSVAGGIPVNVIYRSAITVGTTIDCCVPIVVTRDQGSAGWDADCPLTLTFTPAGCGDAATCDPDPSGDWTLTQLPGSPCQWYQAKAGVSAVFSILYDPVTGTFEGELIISSATYTMVFVGFSVPGLTAYDCTALAVLGLVYQDQCPCSEDPMTVTLTPVATSSACCGPAPVACDCTAVVINNPMLYVRFTGALADLGCVEMPFTGVGVDWQSDSLPMTDCSPVGNISMDCDGDGTFTLFASGLTGGTNPSGLVATSCDSPFELSYNGLTDHPGDPTCDGLAWGVMISSVPC